MALTLSLALGVPGFSPIVLPSKQIKKSIEKTLGLSDFELKEMVGPACLNRGVLLEINEKGGRLNGFVYTGRVPTCRLGGCKEQQGQLMPIDKLEDLEYFDFFAILDKDFAIRRIRVFNYAATHGHEVASRGWLKQFIGFGQGSEPLVYGKNIDAVSGATISAMALTDEVSYIIECLEGQA